MKTQITHKEFESVLKSEGDAVFLVVAEWVHYPQLREMADYLCETMPYRSYLADVDDESMVQVYLEHNLRTVPSMIFIKSGEVVEIVAGCCQNEHIFEALTRTELLV